MKLDQLDADTILEVLEQRQDNCADAQDELNRIEAAHKRLEAGTQLAYKDSGMSVAEAKMRMEASEAVADSLVELHDAQNRYQRARYALDRAKHAKDLFQTARADARRV